MMCPECGEELELGIGVFKGKLVCVYCNEKYEAPSFNIYDDPIMEEGE